MTAIPPLDGLTLGAALQRAADRHPHREALVFREAGVRVDFAELDCRVDDLARSLLALDLRRDERVALWAPDLPETYLLHLALARTGAVVVPVGPDEHEPDLSALLLRSGARAVFLASGGRTPDPFGAIGRIRDGLPELRFVVALGGAARPGILAWPYFQSIGRTVPMARVRHRERRLLPDDPARLQFTSGTTGARKGVLLSHRTLLADAVRVGRVLRLGSRDRVCTALPSHHPFGTGSGLLACLAHECALVVPSAALAAADVLDTAERERATAVVGTPTRFAELLDAGPGDRDLSSVRTGVSIGPPGPAGTVERVVETLAVPGLTVAYGLTEAGGVVAMTDPDDPLDVRVRTVGRPLPGLEVRIADPLHGVALRAGDEGELLVRGTNPMLGYLEGDAPGWGSLRDDGWIHTGDTAVVLEDGRLRVTARVEDRIVRGGERVLPREIEECLHRHPAVVSAQAVGVPDASLGQEVCVWVRLREGTHVSPAELRMHCKDRLPASRVPRYVKLVERFPTTSTGKVQKGRIREMATRELGLNGR